MPVGTGLLTRLDVFEHLQRLTCDGVEPAAGLLVIPVVRMVVTTFAAWEGEQERGAVDLTATLLGEQLIPGAVGLSAAPASGASPPGLRRS